jgi:aerobic carbon-monoxide dehydrogenase large subunit
MVFTGVKGDAEVAFRDADYVRRDRFIVQRYTALPMEPRGVLAEWDAAQGRTGRSSCWTARRAF